MTFYSKKLDTNSGKHMRYGLNERCEELERIRTDMHRKIKEKKEKSTGSLKSKVGTLIIQKEKYFKD